MTRGLAELQTSIMAHALPLLDCSVDRFVILSVLVAEHFRAEPGYQRPISILALAQSLSKPFETTRRHVKGLAAQGWCQINPDGIVLNSDLLSHPPVAALSSHIHDCLVRFIAELVALDTDFRRSSVEVPYGAGAGLLAASDLMLAVAANNSGIHSSFTDLVIFSAVLACNYRVITATRPLARRLRNETQPTPPNLLHSARPSVVARALGLPESTVRRRMIAMLDGPLVQDGQGFLVSERWLNREDSIAVSRASVARVRRVFGALAQAGFPFHDPGRAYLNGQAPPHVAFA